MCLYIYIYIYIYIYNVPSQEGVWVTIGSHICTKGFFNYLSVIVVFLKVVFKDEIIKFLKHCGTFIIKES